MSSKKFHEKELFQTVQKIVEERLNAAAQFVHPYCLSLDSIGNALNSFVSLGCITRQFGSNGRADTRYIVDSNSMKTLFEQFNDYCTILRQFNALSNYILLSKL